MEKRAFPTVHEILSGRFVRHSRAYYEWRIKDRTKKLGDRPNDLRLIDDLAVAYEKTGRTELAIQWMERSLKLQPKRYETLANLGTFHVHAGNLEKGLAFIKQAIKVNPDAHFGREVIQLRVVEYVLERRKKNGGELAYPLDAFEFDPKKNPGYAPLSKSENPLGRLRGFMGFLKGPPGLHEWGSTVAPPIPKRDIESAVRGVTGMMVFGSHEHPVLLECLANLLSPMYGWEYAGDAKRLGVRAYLRAAQRVEDAAAKQRYRAYAIEALKGQAPKGDARQMRIEEVEKALSRELGKGRAFFAQIEADEKRWIEAGVDVDAAFARKYYAKSRSQGGPRRTRK